MSFRGFGDFSSVLSTDGDVFMGAPSLAGDQQFAFASSGLRNLAKSRATRYITDAMRQGANADAQAMMAEANAASTGAIVRSAADALGKIGGAWIKQSADDRARAQGAQSSSGGDSSQRSSSYRFPDYTSTFSTSRPLFGWG